MSLKVNIKKRLGNFNLDVDSRPSVAYLRFLGHPDVERA